MKTDFNFENAKVGDKVFHVIYGWCEITDKDGECIEIQDEYWYNYNGKFIDSDLNPTVSPYNPFEQNNERVVEVQTILGVWQKRVLIMVKNGHALCWVNASTLEEAENELEAHIWSNWREIEPQKELTQKEKINILWEKYGKEL